MNLLKDNLLTILIFLPIVGVALMALHGAFWGKNEETQKRLAIGFSLLNFVLSLLMLRPSWFNGDNSALQLGIDIPWISTLGLNIHYHVAVDGLSVWLVILTTLLFPIAILGSWNSIHKKMREFLFCLLLLESVLETPALVGRLLQVLRPLLALSGGAGMPALRSLLEVNRTCRGHGEIDAVDP